MNKPTPGEKLGAYVNKAVEFETRQESKEEEKRAAERDQPYHLREKTGYIVRIELHGIEERQRYHKLHDYLKDAGFDNVIVSNRGAKFKLPAATYYFANPGNQIEYREVHTRAALGVQAALQGEYADIKAQNDKPTILVTRTDLVYWSGLIAPDAVTE
jgi:hypothetical protein